MYPFRSPLRAIATRVMDRNEIIDSYKRLMRRSPGAPPPSLRHFIKAVPALNQHMFRSGFWRSWRDFQREAGVSPNEPTQRLPDADIIRRYAELARKLGRVPTDDDLKFHRKSDPTVPSTRVMRTRAPRLDERIELLREYCAANDGWADVLELLASPKTDEAAEPSRGKVAGVVYLMKDGRHFKIGKTNSVGRRHAEASTWLRNAKVVHTIETDDPDGVERYWHRRFEAKLVRGEWFSLTAEDVAAFRRWRRIV